MAMRDVIMRFMSAEKRAAAEAESREWMVTCPHCSASTSMWDLGSIRYKAAGTRKSRFRCAACGEQGWHLVARRPQPGTLGE